MHKQLIISRFFACRWVASPLLGEPAELRSLTTKSVFLGAFEAQILDEEEVASLGV